MVKEFLLVMVGCLSSGPFRLNFAQIAVNACHDGRSRLFTLPPYLKFGKTTNEPTTTTELDGPSSPSPLSNFFHHFVN
jgi:hypothetical protein